MCPSRITTAWVLNDEYGEEEVPGDVSIGSGQPQSPLGPMMANLGQRRHWNGTDCCSTRGGYDHRRQWRLAVRRRRHAARRRGGRRDASARTLDWRIRLVHRTCACLGARVAHRHPAGAHDGMIGRERQDQDERRQTPAEGHHSPRMRQRDGTVSMDAASRCPRAPRLVACPRHLYSGFRAGHPGWRRCSSLKYIPSILGRRALPSGRRAPKSTVQLTRTSH